MKLYKGLRPPHRGSNCKCQACAEYHAKHGSYSINFKPYSAFRYRSLILGFHSVRENPNFFSTSDCDIALGCSQSKVESTQHYLEAFQLIHRASLFETLSETQTCRYNDNLTLTEFGKRLFDRDPYFESLDSLYLLHYHLTTSPMALAFYYVFNCFIPQSGYFSRNEATDSFEMWLSEKKGKSSAKNTIRQHINTVLRTYTEPEEIEIDDWADMLFIDLNLIECIGEKGEFFYFNFDKDKEVLGLSTAVFGYALISFWDKYFPHTAALDLKKMCWVAGSPFNVFKLSENRFMEYITKLKDLTGGAIEHRYSTNLNQLYRTKPIESFDFLEL